MIQKFKNIISLLLVLLLLTPSIVKFEHHHSTFECKAKNENHIHTVHEKCLICSFELSFFSTNTIDLFAKNAVPFIKLKTSFYNFCFSNIPKYSFSLRAPPSL